MSDLLMDAFENLDQGIIVANSSGVITHINSRLCELLGDDGARLAPGSDIGIAFATLATLDSCCETQLRAIFERPATTWPDRLELPLRDGRSLSATKRTLGDGAVMIWVGEDVGVGRRVATLSSLTRARPNGVDLFTAAAEALAIGLRYRWARVTRFIEGGRHALVIGSWDDGVEGEHFTFKIAGTPCEFIAQRQGFHMFADNVAELYPAQPGLRELGVRTYVGDVFFGANGAPAGHVFAMNDQPDGDCALAREVTRLVAAWVGQELQHAALRRAAAMASEEARTDPLTCLGNRKAFEEELQTVSDWVRTGRYSDATLAVIDLDGLKSVNDALGHAEGDELLRAFARKLAAGLRADDRAYRFGGDEFALVIPSRGDAPSSGLRGRIGAMVDRLRLEGFPDAAASVGTVTLKECDLDVRRALRLGDQRMYQAKRGARTGQAPARAQHSAARPTFVPFGSRDS